MTPLRIYADFNGLVPGPVDPTRIAVVLDTWGSARDLANAGVVLQPGYHLCIGCRTDLGHGAAAAAVLPGVRIKACPTCGLPIDAPLRPPPGVNG